MEVRGQVRWGAGRTYQGVHILQLHDIVLDQKSRHQVEAAGSHLALLVVGGNVEIVFEAQELTHCPRVWDKLAQQRDEELVMLRLALKALQNYIENTVGIKIEISNDGLDHFYDVAWSNCGEILQRKYFQNVAISSGLGKFKPD